MSTLNFDLLTSLQEGSSVARPDKPIWKLIKDGASDDDLHKWLLGEKSWLEEQSIDRLETIKRNLARYRGLQYWSQELRARAYEREDERDRNVRQMQKLVVNNVYDQVQASVSRLIKYRPAVAILPTNVELTDRVAAQSTKELLDHIWYVQRFEGDIQPEFMQVMKIMGEAFLNIEWDPNAGDEHEEWKDYKADFFEDKEVVLKKSDGEPELDDEGNPIKVERPVKIGDVKYDVWLPTDILLQRVRRYEHCDYMYHRELYDVAEARELFPGNDDKISDEETAQVYDFERMNIVSMKGKIYVWRFMHRHTWFLPKGIDIYFTTRGIIKKTPLKYQHGKLPVARLADIEPTGEVHGRSFIELIAGLAGAYNNLTNMIVQNQVMAGRPKWLMPAGAAKKVDLGNDITIVEYKGPQPPVLVASNPTPSEVFQFREQLKQELQQLGGNFGVSKGTPPPGIKAGVALQFLNEQETERFNETVLKYNDWVVDVARLTLAVAAQYYKDDEKRMVRVLGKQNQWMTKFFERRHLHTAFDIRVQNSSALPQSKAARVQYLLDLNQQFPNEVPSEQVIEMLDLAQDEKFNDYVTRSVRAAEAENEQMMEGDQTPLGEVINDPQEYEDHIIHWRVHMTQIRDWSFKNATPTDKQQILKDHVLAHEMLMTQRAAMDPMYQEQLAALKGWPAFYVVQPQPQPVDQMPMESQGAPPAEGMPQELPPQEQAPFVPPLAGPMPTVEEQLMVENELRAQQVPPIDPTGAI